MSGPRIALLAKTRGSGRYLPVSIATVAAITHSKTTSRDQPKRATARIRRGGSGSCGSLFLSRGSVGCVGTHGGAWSEAPPISARRGLGAAPTTQTSDRRGGGAVSRGVLEGRAQCFEGSFQTPQDHRAYSSLCHPWPEVT